MRLELKTTSWIFKERWVGVAWEAGGEHLHTLFFSLSNLHQAAIQAPKKDIRQEGLSR
jgi:hypothetical protein